MSKANSEKMFYVSTCTENSPNSTFPTALPSAMRGALSTFIATRPRAWQVRICGIIPGNFGFSCFVFSVSHVHALVFHRNQDTALNLEQALLWLTFLLVSANPHMPTTAVESLLCSQSPWNSLDPWEFGTGMVSGGLSLFLLWHCEHSALPHALGGAVDGTLPLGKAGAAAEEFMVVSASSPLPRALLLALEHTGFVQPGEDRAMFSILAVFNKFSTVTNCSLGGSA